jgi:DNA mismatch endonuclease (patch repair protein)
MGYRYRLHRRELPGAPDIIFPGKKKAIFVHGCFWHRHNDPRCKYTHVPQSKQDYWLPKLERNKDRDRSNQARLKELGWENIVIWECQVKDREGLAEVLREFLA